MIEFRRFSLGFIAFLQAFGLTAYCSLIAFVLWHANGWFGKVPGYLGPLLFLILFTTSALVSAILTLGYPVILFWQKKETARAVKLVIYTSIWLLFFTVVILTSLISTK